MFRGLMAALAAASLLAPIANASVGSHAPTAVAAVAGPADAVVSFVVGIELADFYNIYGLSDTGQYALLSQVVPEQRSDNVDIVVPGGHANYAVSGVLDGVESERLTTGAYTPCAAIRAPPILPPETAVDPTCPLPGGLPTHLLDKVQLPTLRQPPIP